MTTNRSRAARLGKVGFALAALIVIDVTAALAQSSSRSRYSYEYATPAETHRWYDRNSADFNT